MVQNIEGETHRIVEALVEVTLDRSGGPVPLVLPPKGVVDADGVHGVGVHRHRGASLAVIVRLGAFSAVHQLWERIVAI